MKAPSLFHDMSTSIPVIEGRVKTYRYSISQSNAHPKSMAYRVQVSSTCLRGLPRKHLVFKRIP